jgi:hypothetical protein
VIRTSDTALGGVKASPMADGCSELVASAEFARWRSWHIHAASDEANGVDEYT